MGISKKIKVGYGVGAVGKDMAYALISGFLMYYYNTVLGVSATFIGVLFMSARIFDAFNDPLMGVIVEKTNTRFGKFRPWIMTGTLLNALVIGFMFSVPENLSGNSLLIYISAAYLLWGITYTIMDIPFWSMIPAITQAGKERETISVIGRSCAGVGFALPTALTMVLVPVLGAGNERTGFRIFAMIVAAAFVLTTLFSVFHVKEKEKVNEKSPSIKEMFRALIQNDQALVVVVAIVMFNASLYLTNQLAIYFFKFDIGNGALYGLFGTVGGAAQILSMMSLPLLRKRFGCKAILRGAILTAVAGYFMLFVLGMLNIANLVLLCIAAIIIFIGFGLATVLTTIFLADTVDYGQWKNKTRNESVIFSMQTFVVKLASAFSALIAGIGLDMIKLDVNAVVQTAETILGLRIIMIIFPMTGILISLFFFMKFYHLDESKMEQIRGEIAD